MNRRSFLQAVTAGAAIAPFVASAADKSLPFRVLGRTGIEVSILGFGAGSRFLAYKEEDKALDALTRALDSGITYIDTARDYGKGLSEERIGKLMPGRRTQVVLATKIPARKADEARIQIEECLKRLQTDYLDVLHIHSLNDAQDLAAIEAKGGVLEALYEARDKKVVRAIGITCHADPEALQTALERHDFDCTQMALNAGLAKMVSGPGGMKAAKAGDNSFEKLALPVAVRKNMGVIAMKVFGQDQLAGAAKPQNLLRYALSLPVSLASVGMPRLEHIEQNIALAREFRPMPEMERIELNKAITTEKKLAMARFFQDHMDA